MSETYAIDFVLNDSSKLQMLRDAVKPYAEEAKNQLSFKDFHNILSNLGDLPFEDENGEEPEIDINVSQSDMDKFYLHFSRKQSILQKELLAKNNLKGSELDALILVGGPYLFSILKKNAEEQVTEKY